MDTILNLTAEWETPAAGDLNYYGYVVLKVGGHRIARFRMGYWDCDQLEPSRSDLEKAVAQWAERVDGELTGYQRALRFVDTYGARSVQGLAEDKGISQAAARELLAVSQVLREHARSLRETVHADTGLMSDAEADASTFMADTLAALAARLDVPSPAPLQHSGPEPGLPGMTAGHHHADGVHYVWGRHGHYPAHRHDPVTGRTQRPPSGLRHLGPGALEMVFPSPS
jgi:hypothetical protein